MTARVSAGRTSRKYFGVHKNNQSSEITFTTDHYMRTHALPFVTSQFDPFHSLRPTPNPSKSEAVLANLRQEIAIKAQELDTKVSKRKELEQKLALQNYEFPPPADLRADKNAAEVKRKDAMRQRSLESIKIDKQEKEENRRKNQIKREQEAVQRQQELMELREERIQELQDRILRVKDYRKTLDLQRSLPPSSEPGTIGKGEKLDFSSTLGTENRFTKKHPKPVFTDPITFTSSNSPKALMNKELSADAANFFGVTSFPPPKKPPISRKTSYITKIEVPLPRFPEPVYNKHTGLNYRDTRTLLV